MRWMAVIVFVLSVWAAIGCTTEATPASGSGSPLDLGQDAFLPGGADDTGGDGTDLADDLEEEADLEPTLEEGEPCTILLNDCDPGLRCTIGLGGQGICALIGPRREGEPCGERGDDCAQGLVCLDPGSESAPAGFRCFRLCHADTQAGCELEQTCHALEWVAEPVGICLEL